MATLTKLQATSRAREVSTPVSPVPKSSARNAFHMGDTYESHTGQRSCKCPLMLSFTAGGGFKQEESSQRG